MNRELPKVYEPQQVEDRIYRMWEENDCFNGDPDHSKDVYKRQAVGQSVKPRLFVHKVVCQKLFLEF